MPPDTWPPATVKPPCQVRHWGLQPYPPMLKRMRDWTLARRADTPDEIWCLEHEPVYTRGVRAQRDPLPQGLPHPMVSSDRGGDVTFHGPGQWIGYPLVDLGRYGLGITSWVQLLMHTLQATLSDLGVRHTHYAPDAPGLYVDGLKLASLGLRVRHMRSYHGVAVNVHNDLKPFDAIHPCGIPGQRMTSLHALHCPIDVRTLSAAFVPALCAALQSRMHRPVGPHPGPSSLKR